MDLQNYTLQVSPTLNELYAVHYRPSIVTYSETKKLRGPENYNEWVKMMISDLKTNHLLRVIQRDIDANTNGAAWDHYNALARKRIQASLVSHIYVDTKNEKSALHLWKRLGELYSSATIQYVVNLLDEFEQLQFVYANMTENCRMRYEKLKSEISQYVEIGSDHHHLLQLIGKIRCDNEDCEALADMLLLPVNSVDLDFVKLRFSEAEKCCKRCVRNIILDKFASVCEIDDEQAKGQHVVGKSRFVFPERENRTRESDYNMELNLHDFCISPSLDKLYAAAYQPEVKIYTAAEKLRGPVNHNEWAKMMVRDLKNNHLLVLIQQEKDFETSSEAWDHYDKLAKIQIEATLTPYVRKLTRNEISAIRLWRSLNDSCGSGPIVEDAVDLIDNFEELRFGSEHCMEKFLTAYELLRNDVTDSVIIGSEHYHMLNVINKVRTVDDYKNAIVDILTLPLYCVELASVKMRLVAVQKRLKEGKAKTCALCKMVPNISQL